MIAALGLGLLLLWGESGEARLAPAEGKRGSPGEIVPIDSTRTLWVEAYDFNDYDPCHETDSDAAEGFEDYDNTIVADCGIGVGRAGQQSYIRTTSLSAVGYAYAKGVDGGGYHGQGEAESVYEVVFDSPSTQWCTLSGEISTEYDYYGTSGRSTVRLSGPGGVLHEWQLLGENNTLAFSVEVLLEEGEQYNLFAESVAWSSGADGQMDYSVFLDLTGSGPTVDVGVQAINSPPSEFPAGDGIVNATIANFGVDGADVPVHCEISERGLTFLNEDFDGAFPPSGWTQEQAGEWRQTWENDAGGTAPNAHLAYENIIGDFAYLDTPPLDTTGATRLILEFKHRLSVENETVIVYSRSSNEDDWTDVSPWPNPIPYVYKPALVRIDIGHDIGPATQLRFAYEGGPLGRFLYDWYLNDVRIYDLDPVYIADETVYVAAVSEDEVEFGPPWSAPEGLNVLDVMTELPGDENPDNDALTEMLTIGPITHYENQILVASDGADHDDFGLPVAIDGELAIIGAKWHDIPVNKCGAAYVYRFDGSNWIEEQKLTASDAGDTDLFGGSVAISGETVVVGADWDDNENGGGAGSAYVFRFDHKKKKWCEEAKLLASDGAPADYFGDAVAIQGDVVVVGASHDDDNGEDSGSAYVYRFDGSTWVEEQKLLALDGEADDSFGAPLSISDQVIVTSVAHDDNLNGENAGTVYVFRYDGTEWVQEAQLTASDGAEGDRFGRSVAIKGAVMVVGAPEDDDLGTDCGSAYVFRHDGSAWVEEAKLLASDLCVWDEFGWSVDIDGDSVVVSSMRLTGADDGGSGYRFTRQGDEWVQNAKLMASDIDPDHDLGYDVAVSGGTIMLGAPGVNDDTGAVYVFSGTVFGDVNGDGVVDIDDIFAILAAWGPCDGCPEDVNGDGVVDIDDLFEVLANWT
ncbi:MAG: hypothetical protein JSV91_11150 [Phycisphaerales bacterium]|nr:MAG: hypothetical protein JSV91_11150 [Phycisphaerales bacterium]